jgi:hypothetical protein
MNTDTELASRAVEQRPQRRRWLKATLLCLLAGAFANYVGAIACAVFSSVAGRSTTGVGDGAKLGRWLNELPSEWRSEYQAMDSVLFLAHQNKGFGYQQRFTGFGSSNRPAAEAPGTVTASMMMSTPQGMSRPMFDRLHGAVVTGWPFSALKAFTQFDGFAHDPSAPPSFEIVGGIDGTQHFGLTPVPSALMPPAFGARIVPLRPIWPGFLYGSLAYAGVFFAPFALRGAWRKYDRARRNRLGLCVKCRYDTRGLTRCPECGTEVTSAAVPPRS